MKNSIIAGYMATKLVKKFLEQQPNRWVVEVKERGITLTIRRCSLREELSGGVVLHARGPAVPYNESIYSGFRYTKRLKPGWTEQTLYRHLADLYERARQWYLDPVHNLRTAVMKLAETKSVPEDLPDPLDGHTGDYQAMTVEDCQFWLRYLQTLPNKGPEPQAKESS